MPSNHCAHRCCHHGVPMVDYRLVDLGHPLYLWPLIAWQSSLRKYGKGGRGREIIVTFLIGLYLYLVTGSVGRCQSTSSHGVRCCFAQLNPVPSLLECRLAIWMQLNRGNWHACLKDPRVTMRHRISSFCRTTFANWRTPKEHWLWGVHGCRCYWLRYLREVGHHFLLAWSFAQ